MRARKRILFAVLGLLVFWPLLHVGFVSQLEIDPGILGGFAEYATPSSYQRVFILELRGDREINLHDSWLSDDTRNVYRKLKRRRKALGRLNPPHELAEAILAERPDIEGLKIILTQDRVSNKTSGGYATPSTVFVYRR